MGCVQFAGQSDWIVEFEVGKVFNERRSVLIWTHWNFFLKLFVNQYLVKRSGLRVFRKRLQVV